MKIICFCWRSSSTCISPYLRIIALSLLHLIQLQPSISKGKVCFRIGKLLHDLFLLPLERTGNVLYPCIKGLLLGHTSQIGIFLPSDERFKMMLLSSLDDRGRREAEVPECSTCYFAMLLARINTVLIMQNNIEISLFVREYGGSHGERGYYISLLWMTGILS